ncbi:MAG: hypothetical protein ABIV51_10705 [Saprospiraceae bacterium]
MSFLRIFLLFASLYLGPIELLEAQKPDFKAEMDKTFPDSSKLLWLRTFRGLADELHPVTIILGYDGSWCKGIYYLETGNVWFHLEGLLKGTTLTLNEVDQEENKTGSMRLSMLKNTIVGNWSNIDKSIGTEIKCREVNEDLAGELMSKPFYWIKDFTGKLNGMPINITLQKIPNRRLAGLVTINQKAPLYQIHGKFTTSNELFTQLYLKTYLDTTTVKIDGKVISDQEMQITFQKGKERPKTSILQMNESIKMKSHQYQNYFLSYDFSYPDIENPRFAKYIQSQVAEWEKNCNQMLENYPKDHPVLGPSNRAQHQANCWFEPYFISKDKISGRLVYTNTWSIFTTVKSINYDFTKQSPIVLRDLFKKEIDPDTVINQYLQSQMPVLMKDKDPAYQDWIEQVEFKLIGFCAYGLCLSTDFDPTYGSETIFLPFTELEPYLRPNNPLRNILESTQKQNDH